MPTKDSNKSSKHDQLSMWLYTTGFARLMDWVC